MITIKSITFFFPSRTVGGVEVLFTRLAEYIAKTYNIKVYYIDYPDGYAHKQLNASEITFIDYNPNSKVSIDYDTYLITTPSTALFTLYSQFNLSDSVKLFFWNVHPYDILHKFPSWSNYINHSIKNIRKIINIAFKKDVEVIGKVLQILYTNNALVFMDLPNYYTNNILFNLNLKEKKYLPVAVSGINTCNTVKIVNDKEINIGWLGRLNFFKVYSLINIIENSNAYAQKYNGKVIVHILGDGEGIDLINKLSLNKNVELVILGTKTGADLDKYLINNIDILFAMGTSCLEGARLQIPSALMDFSYSRISDDYKFKWLFESKEFSLGNNICELTEPNNHTFEDILNDIYSSKNKETMGNKCHLYLTENHSVEKVSQMLLQYLSKNNFTLYMLESTGLRELKIRDRLYKLPYRIAIKIVLKTIRLLRL